MFSCSRNANSALPLCPTMNRGALLLAVALGAGVASPTVWAGGGPSPTALSPSGDCVDWTISAHKGEAARQADKTFCESQNVGDPGKLQACLDNTRAQKQVEFFSNLCGEGYVVSLDGQQFALKRLSPKARKPPYLTGVYEGKGVRMRVESPRLLSKEYDEGEPRNERNVVSARYAVSVRVVQGKRTNRFAGEVWYGR